MFSVQVEQSLIQLAIQVIVKCTSFYTEMYVGLTHTLQLQINLNYRIVKCMHVYKNMLEKQLNNY